MHLRFVFFSATAFLREMVARLLGRLGLHVIATNVSAKADS